MNIPINFRKLHNQHLVINGIEFRIESDPNNDGSFWLFPETNGFKDCLFFLIDWYNNKYNVRRCKRGSGYTGDNIIENNPLLKKDVITQFTFKDNLLMKTLDWAMNNKLIN